METTFPISQHLGCSLPASAITFTFKRLQQERPKVVEAKLSHHPQHQESEKTKWLWELELHSFMIPAFLAWIKGR